MQPNLPTNKLFRTALYTSPLIAVLTGTPMLIIQKSLVLFMNFVLLNTILMFTIWTINIGIAYFINKNSALGLHKNWRYVYSFLACLLVTALFAYIFRSALPPRPAHPEMGFNRNPEMMNFGRFIVSFVIGSAINCVILIIQDLIILREKKALMELENAQLKIKNIEATNQHLKQQIHPHFLFNSLNTLKSLIKKRPEEAEDYLMKLSDFLRSSIASGKMDLFKLEEELKLCTDYLQMQKIRFGDALQFEVEVPKEAIISGFLPSFSLQLLVENAIKHNALTNNAPLFIKIVYDQGKIKVSNNIQRKTSLELSTGIGLANLTERYRILSGDEVAIDQTAVSFSVSIKVIDHEGANN